MKWGRVVGVDDGYFERGKDTRAPLILTIMKGTVVEGFRFGWATVDGDDATERIESLLKDLHEQVSAVFLYGTIFAGTNVVSLPDLHKKLKKPIIAVVDEEPRGELIEKAFRVYGNIEMLKRYKSNPPMERINTRRGTLFVSYAGAEKGEVLRTIELYQLSSKIPEPLRLSHLIGRALGRWI